MKKTKKLKQIKTIKQQTQEDIFKIQVDIENILYTCDDVNITDDGAIEYLSKSSATNKLSVFFIQKQIDLLTSMKESKDIFAALNDKINELKIQLENENKQI